MTLLDDNLLTELCLHIVEYPVNLQKFILAGKEHFLTYVKTLQSIEYCEINQDSLFITLKNENQFWDESAWDHFAYMCARYTRVLRLYDNPEVNASVVRGLKENKCLEEVDVPCLDDWEIPDEIFNMIGSRPLKEIIGDHILFQNLSDKKCQVKADHLEISSAEDYVEVLCLKNFSASTIRLRNTKVKKLMENLETAREEKRLCSSLKNVKKWAIWSKDDELLQHLLPMFDLLKKISPKIEEYEVKKNNIYNSTKENLEQYCVEVDKLVSNIEEKWSDVSNVKLHIDLIFKVKVNRDLFRNIEDIKEHFKKFPNYEIVELPELDCFSKRRFTVSKRTIFTEKFFLDTQIEIACIRFFP